MLERLEHRRLLSGDDDYVLEWNAVALQADLNDHTPSVVSTPDQQGPTRSSRAMAIVHAAIFDAVNSIYRKYTPYQIAVDAPKGTSVRAAVARAAHDTLVSLYPKQKARFDHALAASLAEVPDGYGEEQGVKVGLRVAAAILKARAHDGSEINGAYSEPNLPGVFQQFPGEPSPLTPKWGKVDPFTMHDATDYNPAPPPPLKSAAYASAYNEVKALGGDGVTTPTIRTPDQTHIGIYWAYDGTPGVGTPPRLYNQIVRKVAQQERNTPLENARLFALANLSMADAGIACWYTKYKYDFWRPIRGIRQVDANNNPLDDGNHRTTADPNWTPLGSPFSNAPPGSINFTPPFPAYTSGHATFGAAVFETLRRFYGTDDIAFTFVSDEYNGRTRDVYGNVRPYKPRSFDSFSEAEEENGQSRIYLGVHWRFDKTEGIEKGNAIAAHAFAEYLRPLKTHSGPSPLVTATTTTTEPEISSFTTDSGLETAPDLLAPEDGSPGEVFEGADSGEGPEALLS